MRGTADDALRFSLRLVGFYLERGRIFSVRFLGERCSLCAVKKICLNVQRKWMRWGRELYLAPILTK